MHVYLNSNEFDNSIQSQPVFVSKPYIDIEFVRPSDIDLSSPSPSVSTNPSEIAMYDIDIDYAKTPGIESSYSQFSLHDKPSEISMHDIDLSPESPSLHVEHDGIIVPTSHYMINRLYKIYFLKMNLTPWGLRSGRKFMKNLVLQEIFRLKTLNKNRVFTLIIILELITTRLRF